jgi:Holliday junction resolvase-like predicted endonuclease
MNKYDPLRDYLAGLDQTSVTMSFGRVEQLVGPLPASARMHRPWWANDSKVEARAWRAAGWHVDSVDQRNERVVFAIGRVGGSHLAARTGSRPTPDGNTRPAHSGEPSQSVEPTGTASTDTTAFGRPEADVQAQIVEHLTRNGWSIARVANTASREQGIDIIANKGGLTLAIEVKGWPGTAYADPRRAHETKPTAPSLQARHWFSHAVLASLLMTNEHPGYEIAIGLPDMPTYRNLHGRIAGSLQTLGVKVLFVDSSGNVQEV